MAPYVYLVVHSDKYAATTILSVFAALDDANAECLVQAAQTGFEPATHAAKVEGDGPVLNRPLRWDAPDGVACWVEAHRVRPMKVSRAADESERATT